ncbi:MAG: SIMPL domain-containing protein, partial [Actinomycetota bacterium]|nr:SIMPL domain-containing protein [Actinomycetota bacterium]
VYNDSVGKTVGMEDLIVVRGTASRTCAADRGVLVVTARVKQPSAAESERALAELTTRTDEVLDRFVSIISGTSTVALSIRPNSYWHPETGRTVIDGHVGERGVRITIADPAQVGSLLRALYDAASVEVSGPDWELADDNPLHAELRRDAAKDARQRAEQYAEGLGLSVGGVAFVREPGIRSEPPGLARALSFQADAEAAPEPRIDLGAAEIQLSASVEVGFRIEPGR